MSVWICPRCGEVWLMEWMAHAYGTATLLRCDCGAVDPVRVPEYPA